MKSQQFSRSAGTLVWGVGVLVVAVVLLNLGASAAPSGDGAAGGAQVLVVLGVLGGLVGLVVLLLGVRQLATNVDLAAKVAADVLAREELAKAQADHEARRLRSARGGS